MAEMLLYLKGLLYIIRDLKKLGKLILVIFLLHYHSEILKGNKDAKK